MRQICFTNCIINFLTSSLVFIIRREVWLYQSSLLLWTSGSGIFRFWATGQCKIKKTSLFMIMQFNLISKSKTAINTVTSLLLLVCIFLPLLRSISSVRILSKLSSIILMLGVDGIKALLFDEHFITHSRQKIIAFKELKFLKKKRTALRRCVWDWVWEQFPTIPRLKSHLVHFSSWCCAPWNPQ